MRSTLSMIVLGGALGVPSTRNPLHAGPNPCPRVSTVRVGTEHAALKAGSCAAGLRELGQVRKEAALSGWSRVPQERLAGAGDSGSAGRWHSTAGARSTRRTFGAPFEVGCSKFEYCELGLSLRQQRSVHEAQRAHPPDVLDLQRATGKQHFGG